MTDARFRAAARAYVVYGLVYLVGGLYLISQGVGVMGASTGAATTRTMLRWGLIGLIPLVAVPWLLAHRWSWLGGWLSRRAFAWVLAVLLAVRAVKVAEAVWRSTAAVAAPWGGEITFRVGAIVFLVVTLTAFGFVVRAALSGGTER
jgi:hypothetical protein